ncbi:MAG: SGNH/GDSL hydrolase family protein [Cytophagaceae bacterium]
MLKKSQTITLVTALILILGTKLMADRNFIVGDVKSLPMIDVLAGDPRIQYTGRIDFSGSSGPVFCYPGISIKAKFEGSAIDLMMSDQPLDIHSNFYNIIIDGNLHSVIKLNKNDTIYPLARNLSNGVHTIEVFKRTECIVGKSRFIGFRIQKGKRVFEWDKKPERRMEFIGNSITCGYGNEGADEYQHFADSTENNYMAFGAITARLLNAEYMAVAYSGKGVYRNYGGSEEDPLPAIYNRVYPDEINGPKWDFKKYTPDVVVVDLGTNDFYQKGTDTIRFKKAYSNFLKKIRENYPTAKIFCVVGPMMNDGHPPGENALSKIHSILTGLVNTLNMNGDKEIFYFSLTTQGKFGLGSDYHPTAAQHQFNAEELSQFIKQKAGW